MNFNYVNYGIRKQVWKKLYKSVSNIAYLLSFCLLNTHFINMNRLKTYSLYINRFVNPARHTFATLTPGVGKVAQINAQHSILYANKMSLTPS